MSKNVSSDLKEEQIAILKNPPSGGPFHEVNMSEKKLIDDGYLYRSCSQESYELTEKGRDAVNRYEKSKGRK